MQGDYSESTYCGAFFDFTDFIVQSDTTAEDKGESWCAVKRFKPPRNYY